MGEKQWSSVERICLYLLRQTNTRSSLLQIHAFMLRNALQTNAKLAAKFISVVASLPSPLSLLRNARHVFDKSPHRQLGDPFLCNSAIEAHLAAGQFSRSLAVYKDLRRDTVFVPDGFTFLVLVKACGSNMAVREGEQVHNHVVKKGFLSNLHLVTALVDMYAKFGRTIGGMVCSRKLFDETAEKDSAVYNAVIDGYAKMGDMSSARDLFEATEKERNVVAWTSMIHGYCHAGDLESARSLFDAMPEKNLVSWNAMMSGYCMNEKPGEALRLFHELQADASFEPDKVTIMSVLSAIADLGALNSGRWVHRFVQRKMFGAHNRIGTALVDMYSKCGEVSEAKRIFDGIREKEIVSWNAMINGFAVNGHSTEALELFSEMRQRENSINPNQVTILGVLSACNHCGLVEEAKRLFEEATERFGLVLEIEHYGCMVDLLGRAGLLDEAERLVETMPFEPNGLILSSFVSSCGHFGDAERARRFLGSAARLEHANFVAARNLYALERRWSEAEEASMKIDGGLTKEAGLSAVEVGGTVSEFLSGNGLHRYRSLIDSTLEMLQVHMKYPQKGCLLAVS